MAALLPALLSVLALLGAVAPPAAAAAGAVRPTVMGSAIQMRAGETWSAAVARVEGVDGHLGALRIFQTEPTARAWQFVGDRDAVISFRVPPGQVLAGRYDAAFRAFFEAAPTGRPTWWSYIHEPDVAHNQGQLPDLAQYRAAFAHVARIARATGNRKLRTTLILVGYSGNPQSGQSIKSYWPGPDLTDVIGWDVYNGWATRRGSYGTMSQIALDRAASLAVGKAWGVGEFGSVVLPGDNGAGRGAWITELSRYAAFTGAQFSCYFDSNTYGQGSDYRLLDEPSRRAFHRIVTDRSL